MKKLGAGLTLLLLLAYGVWLAGRSRTFQFFGEIVPRVETDREVVNELLQMRRA